MGHAVKRYIEFLGLPGSGKTTLARELCGYLNSNNHKAFQAEEALYVALRRRSHYYNVRYPIKYCSYERGKRWLHEVYRQPRFSYDPLNRFLNTHENMTAIFCSILQRPENIQDCALLIKWLVRLCGGYQLTQENLKHDEVLVVDEGFCNRAISLFGYGSGAVDYGNLQAYVTHLPAPDLVMCVEASPATREKRLSARGYPARFKSASAQRRKELYCNFDACVSMVVAGLESRGISVLHIDNDGPLEHFYQNTATLLAHIFP